MLASSPSVLCASLGFVKSIMPCIHHHRVLQNNFIALILPWVPPVYPSPPAPTAPGCDLLPVSVVSSFPECCIIGIIQSVAFSDWLLSLTSPCAFKVPLYLPVTRWLTSIYCWILFYCKDVSLFFKTSRLLSLLLGIPPPHFLLSLTLSVVLLFQKAFHAFLPGETVPLS